MTFRDPGDECGCEEHETLFALPPASPAVELSYQRRMTIQNRAVLTSGRHPVSGRRLLDEPGLTCGMCAHHFANHRGGTYHKCDLNATHGPATDIRVSWPACTGYQPDHHPQAPTAPGQKRRRRTTPERTHRHGTQEERT